MPNQPEHKTTGKRRPPRFDLSGGYLCLDFINTLDHRPSDHPKELLTSYNDLLHFAEDAGALDTTQVARLVERSYLAPKESQRALQKAIELREVIFQIFWAIVNKQSVPALALAQLNGYVQYAGQHSRLIQKGSRFELGFDEPDGLDVILWPIARSAANLITSTQLPYVRACSMKTCQWLFLDISKNHRRRWCNMKVCGNRAKVRRFYAKSRTA
jgi:predicted RNA-binding Zn ribbon-like protein